MALAQRLARPLLASSIVAAGVNQLREPESAAHSLEPALGQISQMAPQTNFLAANPELVARAIGGIQAGAGTLLALGKLPRAAAVLLGAAQTLTAAVEFFGAPADTEEEKQRRTNGLLKNASIIGGVIYASIDRGGKPSLAWRAEHLVRDTQKQAAKAIDNLKK